MFTDIEQLEKEVQEFRKNIIGANSLVKSMDATVEAIKEQTKSLTISSELLTKEIKSEAASIRESSELNTQNIANDLDACILELKGINDNAIAVLKASNGENLEEITARITGLQKVCDEEIRSLQRVVEECSNRLSAENETYLAKTVTDMKNVQQELISDMQNAVRQMNNSKDALLIKYSELMSQLEKNNIDQIYQMCVDMKKSVETKFKLLFVGVGLAVIVGVLGVFL